MITLNRSQMDTVVSARYDALKPERKKLLAKLEKSTAKEFKNYKKASDICNKMSRDLEEIRRKKRIIYENLSNIADKNGCYYSERTGKFTSDWTSDHERMTNDLNRIILMSQLGDDNEFKIALNAFMAGK